MTFAVLDVFRNELSEVKSDRRSLRIFGLVMCGALSVIAALVVWQNGWQWTNPSIVLSAFAASFALLAIVFPNVLWPVHRAWMGVAIVLGFVMTRVILSIVFYLVITPIGLVLRAIGRDPLAKGPDPTLPSYWIPKVYRTRDRDRFEKYY